MQNKQQIIQRIIQQHYYKYKYKRQLNLCHQRDHWSDVLLERDWSQLQKINLARCLINCGTFSIFCELNWPNLTDLYLYRNKLNSRGIQLMMNCNLTNLQKLDLDYNLIGNNGTKYLSKINFPNLQQLKLINCQIGSEGIKHLIKAKWPQFRNLYLGFIEYKNANKLQINGWEMIYQFQKIYFLYVWQIKPICWIHSVLLPVLEIGVGIEIQNYQMEKYIKRILRDRKFMKD